MKQIYKIFFAVVAVLASLFFLVLAGKIYPALYLGAADAEGNLDFFRQDLVDRNFTMALAMTTVLIPWVIAAMYYYVVNSVHLDRWWHWLGVMVISALLCFYASWQYLTSNFAAENLDSIYSPYIFLLSVWNILWGGAIFILSSYGIRWWSSNCRHTPIPQ